MEDIVEQMSDHGQTELEDSPSLTLEGQDSVPGKESKVIAIQRLIARVENLPTLPVIASELLGCLDDPDASAAALANLISTDQALATRLLRLANSAYYGFPRRIGTINLAVVVLGFDTVRDLSLSLLITDSFFRPAKEMPLDMDATWRHSVAAAIAGRMLLRSSGANVPGEGFIAGLVHDVGKLFLARYFPSEYSQVISLVRESKLQLLLAEDVIFGLNHAIVGGWLLDEWDLPVWLVDSTRDHHGAGADDEWGLLAQNTCFADALVQRAGYEAGGGAPLEISPRIMSSLRLKTTETREVDYPYYLERLQQEMLRAGDFIRALRAGGESEARGQKETSTSYP